RGGQQLITGSHDHTVILWDLVAGKETTLKGPRGKVYEVGLAFESRRALSQCDEGTLKVWDLESSQELHTLEERGNTIQPIAISADGRRVVAYTRDNTLKIWDVLTGRLLREVSGWTRRIESMALSPNGCRVALGSEDDHNLEVWDLDEAKQIAKLTADSSIWACAFAQDSLGLLAGEQSGRVHCLRLILPEESGETANHR